MRCTVSCLAWIHAKFSSKLGSGFTNTSGWGKCPPASLAPPECCSDVHANVSAGMMLYSFFSQLACLLEPYIPHAAHPYIKTACSCHGAIPRLADTARDRTVSATDALDKGAHGLHIWPLCWRKFVTASRGGCCY